MAKEKLHEAFPSESEFQLTNTECAMIEKLIQKYETKEKFLIAVCALTKTGAVRMFEGLKGRQVIPEMQYKFWSDIPYDFWSIAIEQVESYMARREYAQKQADKKSAALA